MGSLANLLALTLDWNELSGTIPPSLGGLANLKELYLSSNQRLTVVSRCVTQCVLYTFRYASAQIVSAEI